jgi:hypothetical protein
MPIDLPRNCGTEDLHAVFSFALAGLAATLHLLHFASVFPDAVMLLASAG